MTGIQGFLREYLVPAFVDSNGLARTDDNSRTRVI
jgi:hypothetical protein